VQTLTGKPQRWRISSEGGIQPRWRKDGKEILYLAANGKLMSVAVKGTGDAFEPGPPVPLFQTQMRGIRASSHFTMTPDAQRILLGVSGQSTQADALTVIVNWEKSKP
jgi:hypothetical protein